MRVGTLALDDVDWRILRALQEDGRISMKALGQIVGLSAVAAANRVQRMLDEGIVTGFTCVLDKRRMNLSLHVFMVVHNLPAARKREFYDIVNQERHITACYRVMTGGCEAILNVYCEKVDQLRQLENRLNAIVPTSTYLVTADSDKKIITKPKNEV